MDISNSKKLFDSAKFRIPGGVNSPVRAFTQVGGTPRFIKRADGPYLYDVDDNQYVDFIGSWGPMILGHRSQIQINAINEALEIGTSFGAPTGLEVEFAELLCSLIDGLDMVRLVSSGTEATMSAARLARGFTGRSKIIKFNGCYHGHADSFLVQAGSGAATQGISGSLGVSAETVKETISIDYNNLELLEKTIISVGGDKIAAIIVEPVPGNMGLVLPSPGFLEGLRRVSSEHGIVLIFDEVMSGFRVGLKGASGYYNIKPDMFCFGKVIGGGLPIAAFGGKREIMECLAPLGGVYQAGTLSGNPVAVTLGIATLKYLINENPYETLEKRGKQLTMQMSAYAESLGIPMVVENIGSMFGFAFSDKRIENYTDAKQADIEKFKKFFHLMLDEGVYFAPSAFEAGFIGIEHSENLISDVLSKIEKVLPKIK